MADEFLFRYDSSNDNYTLGSGGLAEAIYLLEHSDYVAYGLGLSADYTNLLLDVGSGGALVADGTQVFGVLPDARQDLSLDGSVVNEIFLVIDPSNGSISYDIRSDGVSPSNPHLKIGEVDTSNNTTTELNRAPDGEFETADIGTLLSSLDVDGNDIVDAGTTVYDASADEVAADVNNQSTNTDELSGTITFVSPGDNLQSRIDAAEPGGVLYFETGTHDVATMGTGTIDKPITVVMSGGQVNNDSKGAVLVNGGADTVDSPVLTVENSSPGTFSSRPFKVILDSLNIYHEGGTSAALKVNDAKLVHLRDPLIDCGGVGQMCISLVNGCDMFTARGGQIRRPAADGIVDNATGGSRALIQTNVVGVSGRSTGAGLTTNNTWTVLGGQIAGFETGAHIESDSSAFWSPRFEDVTTGVAIGTDAVSRRNNNWVVTPYFTSVDDVCVEFGLTSENHVMWPTRLINGSTSTNAIRWTADSVRDRVAGGHGQLAGKSWDIVTGATLPTVQLDPTPVVNDTQRGQLNPIEGMAIYNTTDGNLNIHNGSGWILPDGTAT